MTFPGRQWVLFNVASRREIASAIKKLLDAVNEVVGFIPGTSGKQAVEQRKKEFVKYSKKFSTTLKEYFKEAKPDAVFVSALFLVHVTNQVRMLLKMSWTRLTLIFLCRS